MQKSRARRKRPPKWVLALPDLEQAKAAVLNSLTSTSARRTYDHAIRRAGLLALQLESIQQRDEHWVIADADR